ncbi:MAG: hypothetical protein ACTSXW_00600 [Candidatus Baldrarchaeia archaeon]|mgnify:CR=1 FL=1
MSVNPAAIFDPFFIPPKLLHRERELEAAEAFVENGINDQYSLHIVVTGIRGIGKTVFVNYLAEQIQNRYGFSKIFINMHDSGSRDFLRRIVYGNSVCFKEGSAKEARKGSFLIMVLDDVNPYSDLFCRFLRESKERNIIVFASSNPNDLLSERRFDFCSNLDFVLKLGIYKPNQLFDITLQRARLAFPKEVDVEVIRYITDLVCEFDINRPSISIEILRRLYPLVVSGAEITIEDVRKCSHDLLWILNDDLMVLDALRDMRIESILLLEKIALHLLRRPKRAYLSLREIKELYHLLCDEIGDDAARYLFNECLEELTNSDVLFRSSFNKKYFYLAIPPKFLLDLIDAIF